MQEQIQELLTALEAKERQFSDVLAFIDRNYAHTPTAFKNGEAQNDANQNQCSARVFIFAKQHDLSKEDTLKLFAEHYAAVLATPEGSDHQNIRQFTQHGWAGIEFYPA